MRRDHEGKRVLITGSSRGIGKATAIAFRDAGARVAVNGRSPASVQATIEDIGSAALVPAPGDVATAAGCRAVVADAIDGLGGLDILVNCAGIGGSGAFEDCTEGMWDAIVDVNLKGTFFCAQAATGALRQSGGTVVNLGSDAGLIGEAGLAAYCAAKGGVVNLTRALALELAPTIRVNCICPGYVDTDMVRRDGIEKAEDPAEAERMLTDYAPLRRIATPAEIASAILYLASDDARFVTGAALQIDGGTTAGHPKPL